MTKLTSIEKSTYDKVCKGEKITLGCGLHYLAAVKKLKLLDFPTPIYF